MTGIYGEQVQTRFAEFVQPRGDCLLFTGGSTNNEGVPLFNFTGPTGARRRVVAQRAAWEMRHGPLARGLVLIASCGDQRCVSLDHLRTGTKGERVPDSVLQARFWTSVAPKAGDACRPWLRDVTPGEYASFFYRGRNQGTHRLAWMFANGREVPEGMFVCHTCDNPPCCNPDHLFIAPPAGNSADMVAKGRARGGRRDKLAKLTPEQVREIRRRYVAGGVSTHQLAAEYPVTAMVIWKVATGRSYRDVV